MRALSGFPLWKLNGLTPAWQHRASASGYTARTRPTSFSSRDASFSPAPRQPAEKVVVGVLGAGHEVDGEVACWHLLKVRPQKTSRKKRDLIIPLHPELEAHVLDLPVSDNQGPLCPTLAKRKVSGKYGLSIQFHKILAVTEVKQETVEATGKAGHSFNKYTFHRLAMGGLMAGLW